MRIVLSALLLCLALAKTGQAQELPQIHLPAGLAAPQEEPARGPQAPGAADDSGRDGSKARPAAASSRLKSRFSLIAQTGRTRVPQPLRAMTGKTLQSEALNLLADFSLGNPAGALSFDSTLQVRWDDEDKLRASLRRARLVHAGTATLEAGYDYTGWSFFDMFHPLDPHLGYALRIDPEDWGSNHADPFLRVSTALADGRATLMAGSQADDVDDIQAANLFGALRYERQWGQGRMAGQWVHDPNMGNRFGASFDFDAGGVIWVTEWEIARRRELRNFDTRDFGRRAKGEFNRLLLGMRYALGSGSQIDAGYYHNQHGYKKSAWSRFASANDEAASRIGLGDYSGIGLLGASGNLSQNTTLRRNYLFGSLVSGDRLQPFDLTLGGYYGLDDESGLAFIELKRAIGENWSIRLNGSKSFGGAGSEFGRKPSQIRLQLHLKI